MLGKRYTEGCLNGEMTRPRPFVKNLRNNSLFLFSYTKMIWVLIGVRAASRTVAAISCNVGEGCRDNEGVRIPLMSGTDINFWGAE